MTEELLNYATTVEFWLSLIGGIVTISQLIVWIIRGIRRQKTKHLRKVWGIKDKEDVILVCSELDNPEVEQIVDNEFIYNRKYGDLDAYFEVVYTLLKLFPSLKLRILSCGEAASIRMEYDKTIILIGGPDYNSITEAFLEHTQFEYRSQDWTPSKDNPDEIVLFHKVTQQEYCGSAAGRDFGYFERIQNPHNKKKNVIVIGGCHTIGVTGAIKAFSLVPNEQGEVNANVLTNAKTVAHTISRRSQFAVLVETTKTNLSIHTPAVDASRIFLWNKGKGKSLRDKIAGFLSKIRQ